MVKFQNIDLQSEAGKSLLLSLLENGIDIPNGCRSGFCQSCLMIAKNGEPCEGSQSGLKDTMKAAGYFLACKCNPKSDMEIALPETGQGRHNVKILKHEKISENVLNLHLEKIPGFRPGQFITLFRENTGRSYSIASLPGDSFLELHIKLYPDGALTPWIFNELKTGDDVTVSEPSGSCFYTPHENKMLLAGTGTGIAPLYGIARDALASGHSGEIHMVFGGVTENDLYLHRQLSELEKENDNFFYHPCVLNATPGKSEITEKNVTDHAKSIIDNPEGWTCYIAGPGDLVNATKKALFLAGISMNNILSDPFF